MLHAAAMLIGLFVVWLMLAPASPSWTHAGAGALAAAAALALAARFGGVGRAFARAPAQAAFAFARLGATARAASAVLRQTVAADVTLSPALVRVKTRAAGAGALAAFAGAVSGAPGSVVVDVDEEGLLVHVTEEEAVDARALGDIEARLLRAMAPEAGA